MGKDFTFRVSPQVFRMLIALNNLGQYTPSKTVNEAIEGTPDGYLEGKPVLLHVQFSDSAMEKLDKIAKKTGLSKATLVERAIDYSYRKQVMQAAKKVVAEIAEIASKNEEPLHHDLKDDMPTLIELAMPFRSIFESGNKQYGVKPSWKITMLKSIDEFADEIGME